MLCFQPFTWSWILFVVALFSVSRDNDLSAWLTVMPIERDNYDLTAQEFRDALAVRYKKPLLSIPPHCDGCGAPSSLDHFLICKKGGLIVQRHNEIRDAIGDLLSCITMESSEA